MAEKSKPIHAKPSLYAYYFYGLKEIAYKYGYNLVLHGSLNRDLDLIAIPWQKELLSVDEMLQEMAMHLGGYLLQEDERDHANFASVYHGRKSYIINLNRECKPVGDDWVDLMYYIDISVTPPLPIAGE